MTSISSASLLAPNHRPLQHRLQHHSPALRRSCLRLLALMPWLLCVSVPKAQTGDTDSFTRGEATNLAYSQAWDQDESKPALAAFRSWATRFTAASDADTKAQMLIEGVALVKQRRAAFADLIKSDPSQSLALSVPASVRQQLPSEITNELESRLSGIGELSVIAVDPAPGQTVTEPIQRFVQLYGRTYRTFVYGRRLSQTTKYGIPLHGVALDGILALHESALREFEPGEVLDANVQTVDFITPADRALSTARPAQAEMGGKVYRFVSPEQLRQAEARLEDAEAGIGPNPIRSATAVIKPGTQPQAKSLASLPATSWTTGNKNVLIIRVDFSDLPGHPSGIFTASYVQNVADTQVSPFFQQSSYGKTSLSNTVTTQLYRMPQTTAYYATNNTFGQLHTDAETVAASDYTLSNYDRVVVLFSPVRNIFGGKTQHGAQAELGGRRVWLNGVFERSVVTHELGHTYGLYHANQWQVRDGNPISASGSSAEYGDYFDPMGAPSLDDPRADFNPWFKNMLGWIPDTQVKTVTASGIYRINRFDGPTASGMLALKIVKDSTRNYWIGIRRSYTNNAFMRHGAYIIWGYNGIQQAVGGQGHQSDLIDLTTPGENTEDAALAIGATFIDSDARITIRPLAEGSSTPNEYLDVRVTIGESAPPAITSWPKNQEVLVGQSAVFAVAASGIPAPRYQWQRLESGSTMWSNLSDNATYFGSGTATMTVRSATATMNGDQFQCVVSNAHGTITSFPTTKLAVVASWPKFAVLAGLVEVSGSADGTGSSARFNSPEGVAVDGAGNVYVADRFNHTIRKITPNGAVSTLAGLAGIFGSADGTVNTARFNSPEGVAVDGAGNVYVADTGNHAIRKITPGGLVSTLAGLAGNNGSADGTGSAARFDGPTGVAVDGQGNVYVADSYNNTIRKIGLGGVVATLAGLAQDLNGDSNNDGGNADGKGSAARFYSPSDVAVDSAGNVYVADRVNNTIRKITQDGVVSTVAGAAQDLNGDGYNDAGSGDGTGNAARFRDPHGIAVDSAGNVYVADTRNNTIRKITPDGMVSTLAGQAESWGSEEGTGSMRPRFSAPMGVAVDSAGSVYVADTHNHTIRKGIFLNDATTRTVQIGAVSANPSTPAAVPIMITSSGDENAMSFSLAFPPTQATFGSVVLSNGASGGALIVNTNQAASGQIGVVISLGVNQTISQGAQQLAIVTLNLAPGLTNGTVVPVHFANSPAPKSFSDSLGNDLLVNYVDGSITVVLGYEGDIAPRPNGNGSVNAADLTVMGRIVAGLEINFSIAEFQRADCAPRLTLGNDTINVGDLTQVARYVAGLDPQTSAGGPTGPIFRLTSFDETRDKITKRSLGDRRVSVGHTSITAGGAVAVSLQMAAQGNENALSFSLAFDTSKLSLDGITLGGGASNATLIANTNQAKSGRIGVVIAMPVNRMFPAGIIELLRATFIGGGSSGSIALGFTNTPALESISDIFGNDLLCQFVDGAITVEGNTGSALGVQANGDRIILSWGDPSMTLEEANAVIGPWRAVLGGSGSPHSAAISSNQRFYRLRK